ncbi:hypothetical protein AB0P05_45440 [Streptomyces flaveolus]
MPCPDRAGRRGEADHRPDHKADQSRRRRLLCLSVRLWWHPYWETVPSAPAARSELRHLACAHGAVRIA